MPSWLRRLFSRNFRNAVAAEAAGDYILAAEQYALAEMPGKVAEMHYVRARRADPVDRADVLDDALRWFRRTGENDEFAETFPEELAQAILSEAQALAKGDPRRQALALDAAALYEEEGLFREAGEAFEFVRKIEEAVRCYEAAGYIEGMERLLEEDTRARASSRAVCEAFDDYETALANGARDRARIALRRCCSEAPGQGYERMLADLEKRFPTPGSVDLRVDGVRYVVVGATPAYLGRGDAHVQLRHAGISRRHAAIDADQEGFHLRDAGSRNGTLIGGLPLAGRVPLVGSGIIGLGHQCTLQFSVTDSVLELEVLDGPDRSLKAIVVRDGWTTPDGTFKVSFRGGVAVVKGCDAGPLLLNDQHSGPEVVLLIGDTVEANVGCRIEVTS